MTSYNVLCCDRFFTGQNGRTSCTPLNPFSLPKANTTAAASVARKLNLSSVHDSSTESSRGGKLTFDICNHLQDDIDIIEQSPVKENMSNGHIENMQETSALDEVSIIDSPSTPVTAEDVDHEMKINSPLQLQQQNTNVLAKDEDSDSVECSCNEKQTTSPVAKRLGHRDLREFAFRSKAEREQGTPQNSRSRSLPINSIVSSTPALPRKTMSSEDFLCPLERKRHKTVTTEREAEGSAVPASCDPLQSANLKAHDKPTAKNALKMVIDVLSYS